MNRLHHWLCNSGRWRKTLLERVPWVLAGANLGTSVLELGPGPGLATDILRSKLPKLTAVEIDPLAANTLRSRLHGSNVEVVTGDATAMPFDDSQFTGAVTFTMLHHVRSKELQDRLLREVWRVVEPGGHFVGSDSVESLMMRVIHIGDTLNLVNPDTFSKRLENAGFQVLEIEKNSDAFRFHAQRPFASGSSKPRTQDQKGNFTW